VLDARSRRGRALGRALDVLALAAGWALLGLALLVGFEVVVRKFFAYSVKGVDEIGGYVLAIASAAGFIYTLVHLGHIRVDIVLKYLGARSRAVLHLVAYVTLAAFAVLLAWRCAAVWLRSAELSAIAPTPLGTPLILPQGLWVFGLGVFAVMTVMFALQVLLTFVRRGPSEVEGRFHADRLEEEFNAEQQDAARRGATSEARLP
jgi:TRAP-type C4-dicarboxylate transport system permease small subunit